MKQQYAKVRDVQNKHKEVMNQLKDAHNGAVIVTTNGEPSYVMIRTDVWEYYEEMENHLLAKLAEERMKNSNPDDRISWDEMKEKYNL